MMTYKFMVIKQILEPIYAQSVVQWKIPKGGNTLGPADGEGKRQCLRIMILKGRSLLGESGKALSEAEIWWCSLHGAHRLPSGWSMGLRPESPRLEVTVVALLLSTVRTSPIWSTKGIDHNATWFMQTFSARTLSWRCQCVSEKVSTRGELHHHRVLAICIFGCELRARWLGKAWTLLWYWKILSEVN